MIALAIYLLKVIICSALLTGYYFIALRNKFFHQWNRFYLLITVLLSLIIPLFQFTIFQKPEEKNETHWLQYISTGDEFFVGLTSQNNNVIDPSLWPLYAYSFVVIVLLLSLAFSLYKLWTIVRKHPPQKIQNIKFISSDIKGTPFSFFQYIFWNPAIDINTKTGQQVFKHELVHIKEGHTIDKLMMQVVLTFFWCNPFFWLIRYELKMIHEFIADKKATGQQDVSQLATMILQTAYPKHFNHIINPFFHTSIKRRLVMLTKKKNRGFNYTTRILALPLIIILITAFVVEVKENGPVKLQAKQNNLTINDTIPGKNKGEISSINIKEKDVEIIYQDGTKEILNAGEAHKRGLIRPAIKESPENQKNINSQLISTKDGKPFTGLIVLNGQIYNGKLSDIKPESIESVNVLKDQPAVIKYGDRGKNGVIEITSKSPSLNEIQLQETMVEQAKDTIPKNMGKVRRIDFLRNGKVWIYFETGFMITTWEDAVKDNYITREKADGLIKEIKTTNHPLIIVNGKEEPSFTESSLYIYTDESGTKLKKLSSDEAIKKYGSKGANGAIEVTYEQKPHEMTFTKTEIPPTFPGGDVAWRKFLEQNLNAAIPVDSGAPSGTYAGVAQFIVDADGSISDITAITNHGYGIEEEMIKLMKLSPKWNPAMQNKRYVKAYHKQTVTFVIAEN
jgi:beta-lactamase regulating signal transducer with metallopeptidase domain